MSEIFPYEVIDNDVLSKRAKAVYKALNGGKSTSNIIQSMISKDVLKNQAEDLVNLVHTLIEMRSNKKLTFESGVEKLIESKIPNAYHKLLLSLFGFSANTVIGQKSQKEIVLNVASKPRKIAATCFGITLVCLFLITNSTKQAPLHVLFISSTIIAIIATLSSLTGLFVSLKILSNDQKESTGSILFTLFLMLFHLFFSYVAVRGWLGF